MSEYTLVVIGCSLCLLVAILVLEWRDRRKRGSSDGE